MAAEENMSRAFISLQRWAYFLLVLGISATSGAMLIRISRSGFLGQAADLFSELPEVFQDIGLILGATILFLLLLKLSPVKRGQLKPRRIFCFPATWLAVFLAYLLVGALDSLRFIGPVGREGNWWQWGIVTIGWLSLVGMIRCVSTSTQDSKTRDAAGAKTTKSLVRTEVDWPTLEEWLRSEEPTDVDLLNRRPAARRFAEALLHPLKPRTLGLAGRWGSGKTTIVRWIQEELERDRIDGQPEIWLCYVSCWGFDDSSAAVHSILTSALQTINKRADCFSVINLPDAYRRVLSAGAGWLPRLADALLSQPDPTDQLRKLTPILKAMHARLVIVVEDLDRQRSQKFHPQDILALLHRLKSVDGVSFILTGGPSSESKIDFAKLCDHIEMVPQMDDESIRRLIRTFRDHCLSIDGDINPAASYARGPGETELWDRPTSRPGLYYSHGVAFIALLRAVLSFLSTPRTLKHVLRHTLLTWNRLHGEVDFDDLLVVNVIRHGAPEAFDFLLRRIDVLRSEQGTPSGPEESARLEQRRSALAAEWEAAIEGADWDRHMGETLVVFLIPKAARYLGTQVCTDTPTRPQGVNHTAPTDYWRRVLAESLSPGDIRDQDVLRAIDDWSEFPNVDRLLVQRLCSDQLFAAIWEHFSWRVKDDDLLKLASQLFGTILDQDGAKASARHPAVLALWRSCRRLSQNRDRVPWFESMIRSAMSRSLLFAVELYDYWGFLRHGFVSTEERNHLREAMVDEARRRYHLSDPQSLVDVLYKDCPYALRWFILPTDNEQLPSLLRNPADWRWFGPVILAAARSAPDETIPHVAALVCDHKDRNGPKSHPVLILERVQEIFGNQSRELLMLLARPIDGYDGPIEETVKIIRQEALELLKVKQAEDKSKPALTEVGVTESQTRQ
jgi:hypothetical protein